MQAPRRPELWYRAPGRPLRSGTCICRLQSALRSDPGTNPASGSYRPRAPSHVTCCMAWKHSLVHLTGGLLGPSGAPCLHPMVGLASFSLSSRWTAPTCKPIWFPSVPGRWVPLHLSVPQTPTYYCATCPYAPVLRFSFNCASRLAVLSLCRCGLSVGCCWHARS